MHGWRQKRFWGAVVSTVLGIAALCGTPASAAESLPDAVRDLGAWLDGSPNGAGWKAYLAFDRLQASAAQPDADRTVLQEALNSLRADVPGLDHSRFVRVRSALEAQLSGASALPPAEAVPAEAAPVEAVAEPREAFVPIPPDSIEGERQRLISAVDRLQQALSRTTAAKRAGWESYLHLPAFAEAVRTEQPNLAVLQKTDAQLYGPLVGLEWDPLLDLRNRLRVYGSRLYFAQLDEAALREQYESQLDSLDKELSAYDAERNDASLSEIAQIVGWLESAQQAPGVVKRIRSRFDRPNVFIHSNEAALSRVGGQPVYDVRPVHEVILGTDIHGTATTVGFARLDLKPDNDGVTICVTLDGNTTSNNVGTNRGVVICSIGHTRLHATQPLIFKEGYFYTGEASASTPTVATITGVKAKGPLIEAIARRRIAQQKSEADAIATQRAEIRAERQMEERVGEIVARANSRYSDEFVAPLERQGLFPQAISAQSTENDLFANATIAGPTQLGVESSPPQVAAGSDLNVTLHESAVGNVFELLVGGKTLHSEQMKEQMRNLPEGLAESGARLDEEDENWSVTLPRTRPVAVKFADGKVTIILRGRRFTREDQEIRKELEAHAVYEPVSGPNGIVLRRVGEVEVVYPGATSLSSGEVAFKVFMQRRMERAFPAEIGGEGFALPATAALRGNLKIDQFATQDGWLSLGLGVR